MKQNKSGKRYYTELNTLIPSHGNYEKRLLKSYKERINDITENNPDTTYDTLCNILGKPSDIIIDYYSNIDIDYLIKRLQLANRIRKCIYFILHLSQH